jgi:hypothetical protein
MYHRAIGLPPSPPMNKPHCQMEWTRVILSNCSISQDSPLMSLAGYSTHWESGRGSILPARSSSIRVMSSIGHCGRRYPLDIRVYDCCESGYLAYTAHYESWTDNEAMWGMPKFEKAQGMSLREQMESDNLLSPEQGPFSFTYISPFNRLRALFENPILRRKLDYRNIRTIVPDEKQDVFDGDYFLDLCKRRVSWRGQMVEPSSTYFAEATDVALGFLARD